MAKFVGLFLFTRTMDGAQLRAVVHRRGAMRLETKDSPRRPFAWGLQPLCRGPLVAGQEPLDALFAAVAKMFDTSDVMPKIDEDARILSKQSDRMIVYGWQLPWEDVLELRIGACTGSVTTFFKKQASQIKGVSLTKRDDVDARAHDTMLYQERLALLRGFKIFG
jgi:hypothetical protein